MQKKVIWQCRVSPTLGPLEGTHQKVWGTKDYLNDKDPTVFMGLYGLPDFYTLWRHKGIKEVFWCGTDITHFANGYWLEDQGKLRLSLHSRNDLAIWLSRNCGHWVENETERNALWKCGILARVQPSFLGDINKFKSSFKSGNKVYASVSGDNFEQYGWNKIKVLALDYPQIEFHLYGNKKLPPYEYPSNVYIHGRVSKEIMNKEITQMQGGLRLIELDGFSEILAKSILMGQYPISSIDYPHMLKVGQIGEILNKTKPNLIGRDYYRENLNKYPWVTQ